MAVIDGVYRDKYGNYVLADVTTVAPAPKALYDVNGNPTSYFYTDIYGNMLVDTPDVPPPVFVPPKIVEEKKDIKTGSVGGGGSAASQSAAETFFDWMGRMPRVGELGAGWTPDTIRRYAVANNGDGWLMRKTKDETRQIAAAFYGGDPSGLPESLLKTLISDGTYADPTYLQNTYFPSFKGAGADNPLVAPFIEDWTDATGRPLTQTALDKLSQLVRTYGPTDTARAAWQTWLKTTDSAITGNWGADHRAEISDVVNTFLGRAATPAELAPGSSLWELNANALAEAVRATPEYNAIYAGKPAWMPETDWVANAQSFNAAFRIHYGDKVTVNSDGSLTIPYGPSYVAPPATPQLVSTTPTPAATAVAPATWKSLTVPTFVNELKNYGVTATGSGGDASTYTYKDASGNVIAYNNLMSVIPADTFYKDTQGYHYVQDAGAIDPRTGLAATVTRPLASVTPPANTSTAPGGLNNFGVSYVNTGMLGQLINGGYTPGQLAQEWAWQEQADYDQAIYGPMLAATGVGGVDFYKMESGALGSGAMRAQIVQAQNKYAYREAYRQVFGSDPSPADYDRITSEFVSPAELIRETQATESAQEMYPEISDLMQRVYGESITVDELKDMALGRENSGELKAMINQATKLDNYRWLHKQYYNAEPTPDDFAKYAGYASPSELQWEILTDEKIKEFKPDINEAFQKAYGYTLTDQQLQTMLGEQEGYGDLNRLYKDAKETVSDAEKARDWTYQTEQVNVNYGMAEQGGFKRTAPGLANL